MIWWWSSAGEGEVNFALAEGEGDVRSAPG